MTVRQLLCRVLWGHSPVTRRDAGRLQERCFVCDAALGPGWDLSVPKRRRARKLRAGAIVRLVKRERVA